MRLQESGRNPHTRKAYVPQPALLRVGVDVSKAKHTAGLGTQTTGSCRKCAFTHTYEGFRRFEQPLKAHLGKNRRQPILSAMAPAGIYGPALYERLTSCGYAVCLVPGQAVRHNRKTRQEGTRQTDEKDAYSVFALLRQGNCFLPVERAPAWPAAYRLMQRSMAWKTRVSPLRHPLRAAIHLAFPELTTRLKDRTQPPALRFLPTNPTPDSIRRHGRPHWLEQGPPRPRCGQGPPESFHRIDDLATARIGRQDPAGLGEVAIKMLADDLAEALLKQRLWRDQARALLAYRAAYPLLLPLPRIGTPTAAALLPALGDMHPDTNGQQLVKLAGLALRLYARGSSSRKLPKLSPGGRADLRYWLSHSALRRVAPEAHFQSSYRRRKPHTPGTGAGQRALRAVCATVSRMLYRILIDHAPYAPTKDHTIARYEAARSKAACAENAQHSRGWGGRETRVAPAVPTGGENQSVRVGPAPRHATRPKNRRSITAWQTSIALTRTGREPLHVRPHRSYPFRGSAIYGAWPIPCTESITRGVSQQKMLAFFTEH